MLKKALRKCERQGLTHHDELCLFESFKNAQNSERFWDIVAQRAWQTDIWAIRNQSKCAMRSFWAKCKKGGVHVYPKQSLVRCKRHRRARVVRTQKCLVDVVCVQVVTVRQRAPNCAHYTEKVHSSTLRNLIACAWARRQCCIQLRARLRVGLNVNQECCRTPTLYLFLTKL